MTDGWPPSPLLRPRARSHGRISTPAEPHRGCYLPRRLRLFFVSRCPSPVGSTPPRKSARHYWPSHRHARPVHTAIRLRIFATGGPSRRKQSSKLSALLSVRFADPVKAQRLLRITAFAWALPNLGSPRPTRTTAPARCKTRKREVLRGAKRSFATPSQTDRPTHPQGFEKNWQTRNAPPTRYCVSFVPGPAHGDDLGMDWEGLGDAFGNGLGVACGCFGMVCCGLEMVWGMVWSSWGVCFGVLGLWFGGPLAQPPVTPHRWRICESIATAPSRQLGPPTRPLTEATAPQDAARGCQPASNDRRHTRPSSPHPLPEAPPEAAPTTLAPPARRKLAPTVAQWAWVAGRGVLASVV